MTHELLYTSAPQGLKPGSRGFCTVEMTDGIPPGLVDRLESLSGYRQAFPIHDPRARHNPVNYSHLIVPAGGRRFHVLSRVADAGQDYTGRSNKLAHHVALEPHERPAGNPAWVLRSPGFSQTAWDGTTRTLASGRRPLQGTRAPAVCKAWQQASGDSGWAGVLIASAVEPGAKPVSVIYPAGMDVLPLAEEALALVPGERQWEITFSTYFTKLPAGVDCQWRFVLDDTTEARILRRAPQADVIDLARSPGPPPATEYTEWARTGKPRNTSRSTPPVSPAPATWPLASPVAPTAPAPATSARHAFEPSAPPSRPTSATAPAPSAPAAPSLPPRPALATAPAIPAPPQRTAQPPEADPFNDDAYQLSPRVPPPRAFSPAVAPVAVRSVEQLMSGQHNRPAPSRRWIGIAALTLTAAAIVAAVAFHLGRGTSPPEQTADTPIPRPAEPRNRTPAPARENIRHATPPPHTAADPSQATDTQPPAATSGAPLGPARIKPSPPPPPQATVFGPATPTGSPPPRHTPDQINDERAQRNRPPANSPPDDDPSDRDPGIPSAPCETAVPPESD